jgi:hypothetical protein
VDGAINFCQLISILLEDLAIFVAEIGETIVFSAEILNAGIDNIVSGIHFGLFTTLSSLFKLIQGIRHGTVWTISTIYEISYAVGKAVILTVSNLVYGIWRLPVILMITIHDVTKAVLETIGGAGRFTYLAIKEAPIEAFLGFITATTLVYLLISTTRRIIRERQITAKDVICWSFKVICFIYFFIVNFFVGMVKNLVRTLEFTLSHLHVPRFHHAGDSEDEGENDTVEVIEESDAEEEERIMARRRNYDLLIKRRNEKRSTRSKSKNSKQTAENNANADMEEILLEQVEREREDKLCVICQDQEKCIMILPCRHLCICQDCQTKILRRNNLNHGGNPKTCPICRRHVKQMIKAYL